MGRKIRMNEHLGQTVAEVYQDFILAKTAEGVSDVTIRNYHQHLHNISKYLDIEQPMAALSKMVSVLREYMAIRKGDAAEYLFCDQYGEMLSENALRLAAAHYNRSHGVEKTSIHLALHHFW